MLAIEDAYTGANSLANAVYMGNATNGVCLYTDGTNTSRQISACNAAQDTQLTWDHRSYQGDWHWLNQTGTACCDVDSVTGRLRCVTSGTCVPSIITDQTVEGLRVNVGGTTCLSATVTRSITIPIVTG